MKEKGKLIPFRSATHTAAAFGVRTGTTPEGRPNPGAGDAGDGDRPRKNPAGPRTAEQVAAQTRGLGRPGKRPAAQKVSRPQGKRAERTAAERSAPARLSGGKKMKKKTAPGGKKRRAA